MGSTSNDGASAIGTAAARSAAWPTPSATIDATSPPAKTTVRDRFIDLSLADFPPCSVREAGVYWWVEMPIRPLTKRDSGNPSRAESRGWTTAARSRAGRVGFSALLAILMLTWAAPTPAHDIPASVTVLVFVKPEGNHLTL